LLPLRACQAHSSCCGICPHPPIAPRFLCESRPTFGGPNLICAPAGIPCCCSDSPQAENALAYDILSVRPVPSPLLRFRRKLPAPNVGSRQAPLCHCCYRTPAFSVGWRCCGSSRRVHRHHLSGAARRSLEAPSRAQQHRPRPIARSSITALQLRLKLVEGGAASEGAGAQLFQQIDKELK